LVGTRRYTAMALALLVATVALAAPALAIHDVDFSGADTDEPIGLHGWELVVWLAILFWVVQVPIAYLVGANARKLGMSGGFWFAIVFIPTVGLAAAVVYIYERRPRVRGADPGPLGTSRQEPPRSSRSPPIAGGR
jgi:hypothetical protein